jgi:hypothetical protein
MSNSYQRTDLAPGMTAFYPGIYVAAHLNPEHTVPHEVLIAFRINLPKCTVCAENVRFSLKSQQPEPIYDNEFFPLSSPA